MSSATGSMPVVVLTGGIASGKTAVSDLLAARGVPVIDTDEIAREVVAPQTPGLEAVRQAFGPGVLDRDGALDRKALGARVFADTQARKRLEDILHPLIEAAAIDRIRRLPPTPFCLLVVPLLVETGLFADADLVIVVDVPQELQRQRLKAREHIDDELIDRILAAQAERATRLARADRVIVNTGSLTELEHQVAQLHKELVQRYAASP
ncbi:MAG: dephospho-CoA kinase [Wenzhouxiangella sp.]